ncbi:hypothetical protein HAX54_025452, partial [Datura stramonium]|nr:hypothetical protein [Datura stramonium]
MTIFDLTHAAFVLDRTIRGIAAVIWKPPFLSTGFVPNDILYVKIDSDNLSIKLTDQIKLRMINIKDVNLIRSASAPTNVLKNLRRRNDIEKDERIALRLIPISLRSFTLQHNTFHKQTPLLFKNDM